MSFLSMASEITGMIPKAPWNYCQTIVNRALQDVYRKSLWSFQLVESNWVSPLPVTTGLATTVQGSATVTLNGAAAAAVNAIGLFPSPVTQRQFRIGVGTIYNIWGWDTATTLTLDRPYQEASGAWNYQIYQVYFPSPFSDFKAWTSIRDMTNFNNLILARNREWIDEQDPQRSIYYIPTHCVAYQRDLNPASATSGWLLWELWGQPSFVLTYQLAGLRDGPALVNPTDTVPIPLGEDVVMARAKRYAYEWAEANREGGGRQNFLRLMDDSDREFRSLCTEYRRRDRGLVDLFNVRCRIASGQRDGLGGPVYNSASGTAYPGPAF